MESPTNSQKTVSDDDEIDYSVKPEFYESDLDEKDTLWVNQRRRGTETDALLSCPGCFTTLCLDCQRHDTYLDQYRAMFVFNCKIEGERVFKENSQQKKRGKRRREFSEAEVSDSHGEKYKLVCCSACTTEVGVFDNEEVYHFFNVIPSEP